MAQVQVSCPNCGTPRLVDERALGGSSVCDNCEMGFALALSTHQVSAGQRDTPHSNDQPAAEYPQRFPEEPLKVTINLGVSEDGLLRFLCPQCQRRLKVTTQQVGRQIVCPNCRAQLTVPSPGEVESAGGKPPDSPAGNALDADDIFACLIAESRKATDDAIDKFNALSVDYWIMRTAALADDDGVPEVWNVGDVILDLYEVKKFNDKAVFAEGAFGRVCRVHHRTWNLDLAVKSPRPGLFRTDKEKKSFFGECERWVNLGLHPNAVSCHYVRVLGGIPRVFAEFVEGGTLKDWITQGKTAELATALDIAIQIAWGMAFAHSKGLVHRDLKPGNVLMTPQGTAKVADFGLARHGVTSGEALDGQPAGGVLVSAGLGTPGYGAPEQWSKGRAVDYRADIFAFGVTLWRMLGGPIVWGGTNTAQHSVKKLLKRGEPAYLPPQLVELIVRCLEPEPEDRWADFTAVAEQLKQIYAESTGVAYPRQEPKPADALADALNNRALSLLDLGKTKEAQEAWKEALKLDAMHLDSVYNYGLFQWRWAEIDDVTVVKRVREAGAGDEPWRAAVLAAQVELERDDCEAAIAVLQALNANDAERAEVTTLLARARSLEPTSRRCLRTIEAHTACVNSVSLSADGGRVLSGSSDTSMKLWDLATGKCLQVFQEHQMPVHAVCLSADARLVLSGSADKTLKLWDVSTGKCQRTFAGHKTGVWNNEAVTAVSLSPDGKHAISGSTDKKLKLWDLSSGECQRTFEGHKGEVNSACLSCDGDRAISGSTDKTLKLWKVGSGECLATFEGHADLVNSVCLSRDGSRALSGSSDKTVKLWDAASRSCLRTFQGHVGEVNCVCLSSDGRRALSASTDKTLKLWDLETGRCLRTFQGHTERVVTACLASDGRRAVSGGEDRTLRLWEVAGNTAASAPWEVSQPVEGTASSDAALQFANDMAGARSALAAGDAVGAAQRVRHARALRGYQRHREAVSCWGSLYLRLPKTGFADGWLRRSLEGYAGAVNGVHLSTDGRIAISHGSDKTLRLWETETDRCVRTCEGHAGPIDAVGLSMDGRYAVSGSSDRTIKLWDVTNRTYLRTFEGHAGPINAIVMSVDGRYLLSGSADQTLKLWEVESGRCLRTFSGHASDVNSVSLGADSRFALSGSSDSTVKLWEVSTGRCMRTLDGHGNLVSSVSLAMDSRHALSASWDGSLKWWELESVRCLRNFEGHTQPVTSACLGFDGRYALSGSSDSTVKLWEVSTGRCVRSFEGHSCPVEKVYLTVDGRCALSGGRDGTVNLYALDWQLEDRRPTDWDEAARPYLEVFLTQQTRQVALPAGRDPNDVEIAESPTNRGKPSWNEEALKRLSYALACGGFGWLRDDGVRRELESMAATWTGPTLRFAIDERTALDLPSGVRRRAIDSAEPSLAALPAKLEVQGIRFRLVPAGRFWMGSPDSDAQADSGEKPQHRVHITRPFYLGVYPVTQTQYEALMGINPSKFKGDGDCPVNGVAWDDANAFCRKLSEAIQDQLRGYTCRLPTEAEWEYACRAGTSTRYCFGDDAGRLGEYACFSRKGPPFMLPVGQKQPNAWGFCDMHGNVSEWCQDWYDATYYAVSPVDDPVGPARASFRVGRGGSWLLGARDCRSADRARHLRAFSYFLLGFRAVLVPPSG